MASWLNLTEEELMRHEVGSLRTSLSGETDRCAMLSAEVERLHTALSQASVSLHDTNVMGMAQFRNERDALKTQLEDHIKFKYNPLEAQMVEANRVLFEQRLQFRSLVDILALQRDWVREWALQCQENLRLQDLLAKRDAGTEVVELRRHLMETHAKFEELTMTLRQREAASAVIESKSRSLALENERLVNGVNHLRAQNKCLWKRLSLVDGGGAGMG